MLLHLQHWAFWMPGIADADAFRAWRAAGRPPLPPAAAAPPGVSFVAPLVRRRLSAHGRMAMHVAHAALNDADPSGCRSVFASRHGEISRTVGLLEHIVARNSVSPTDFSMAVHNTSSGQFAIWAGNRHPSTAVAAGRGSVAAGFLEAAGQLGLVPDLPLLLVLTDEAMPTIYDAFADDAPIPAAVSLYFAPPRAAAPAAMPCLRCTLVSPDEAAPETPRGGMPQLVQVIEWLIDTFQPVAKALRHTPSPVLDLHLHATVVRLAAECPR